MSKLPPCCYVCPHEKPAFWCELLDKAMSDIHGSGLCPPICCPLREEMEKINFYSSRGEYGCFSNFSRHKVKLDGKLWQTSEHYYQAQKFSGVKNGGKHMKDVYKAKGPMEAARVGRDRKRPMRKDWDSVKDEVMYRVVYAKFTQYEALKKTLLETGDATLVEHTENDSYWGDGGDGSGKNMLGQTLMRVREVIKNEEKARKRNSNQS